MFAKVALLWIGGGVGATLRYAVTQLTTQWSLLSGGFPWGTLLVNIIGCFCIGLLGHGLMTHGESPTLKLVLVTGVLGGFTTFSAFGWEVVAFMEEGRLLAALGYVLLSVLAGVVAVYMGVTLVKAMLPS